ncbi:thiol:disulfide interchange protein DsbG [Oceanospirillum multiglobuliferum]|uniref:Thioredoxin-like fold domain-containing protein n=1 Tax=Oceanospirillum multiglobuliferum TaxID=64969 RepID=A0A1T4LXT6_9GAMM|nr:thioredoxin fold domain-containing protein [Oceanospirillum multiglobuliferum]OPX56317.1 hypothetical protein BTE48_04930 [Oceanospirillum multiglobuliferum]SJZ59540.1 thiol:disulfide interchange protein DsbG [Oceanospirillum multiglobuliferum]
MLRHSFLSLTLVLACTLSQVTQANLNAPEMSDEHSESNSTLAAEALTNAEDTPANNVESESVLELPAPIARAIEQGMSLESQFIAESDLTGWVLSLDGQYTLVYTTPDQRTLISGAIINDAGENLSERYARQYFPKPDFTLLEQAAYISVGYQAPVAKAEVPEKKPSTTAETASADTNTANNNIEVPVETPLTEPAQKVVYAFFDPNCPFCQLTWKAFIPYVAQGVEVRWIPVAFLNASSRAKSAAILQAEQPEDALNESMQTFGSEQQAEASIKDRSRRQLQDNMKLMQRFGIQGTPGIIWLDANNEMQIRSGMPKLHEFAEITGLPEQAQTAPELARFR